MAYIYIYIYIYIYEREGGSVERHALIAFSTVMGKWWTRVDYLALVKQPVFEKENIIKIYNVYPIQLTEEGLGKCIHFHQTHLI